MGELIWSIKRPNGGENIGPGHVCSIEELTDEGGE
jgi:hypothetical protein